MSPILGCNKLPMFFNSQYGHCIVVKPDKYNFNGKHCRSVKLICCADHYTIKQFFTIQKSTVLNNSLRSNTVAIKNSMHKKSWQLSSFCKSRQRGVFQRNKDMRWSNCSCLFVVCIRIHYLQIWRSVHQKLG